MKFPGLYWWRRLAEKRPPDFVIGTPEDPYMRRWYLIPRNNWFSMYVHHFLHSDDDRALHDHPWWNLSILLEGQYTEHTIGDGGVHHREIYKAGDWKFRFAKSAHRVELHRGECWTLFVRGPVIREWGFHCPGGWRHWTEYSKPGSKGEIGPGCGS
jgi:hypothetical protein